ncbi:discoidin domain-containing protein [Verrucomicrobiaceae bacterium 5K15]|uniref:Discoidin domain-containing protein n=1 Tax=Oceaniferula flava TaxID=2800421 RepID=A0AAE2V8Q1_9BACT|nr:discoidin domain-containing protein [Oceaniferula flavus]MBK1855852.1 discoidin domain-containing protein [Oceaniferula flavus]MBM1137159.1 discoidin domain-containing protein [Oceaniferula flavus]
MNSLAPTHRKTKLSFLALSLLCISPLTAEPGDKIYQKGFLSKDEALKSIELKDGYRLELVLSEPHIHEPVAMAWDGNGVLYVVQMRTYMQDADATGEKKPESLISRHEDTDGDGVYDQHSVFIDNLKLPRMVLPLDDRVMVGVTDTLDLWNYRDTDGDGVADEKVKIYEGGRRGGNMEHQPSGLVWNLDNWIYLTYEAKRYRFTDGKLEVQKLPRGGGQWGLSQDDAGRLYYSTAGGEKPALYFQQPIAYGALNLSGQEEPGFRTVYPIAEVPDVQGGKRRVGPNGGLNNFTGVAGQSIYRGDRLPADLKGDLLIPEPVGRLIRQVEVDRENGKSVLRNVHPKSEFIRSRDINFRPVWTATSPDGALMILDMHRGIIQQGNWTRPKSYLRGIIDKWGLDKNIGKGRLYQLVHDSYKPDRQPRMLEESTAELVAHLSHPNGWWRDTAQKLIILRSDRESVVPALEKLLSDGQSDLGRLHALWTLEGMGKLSPENVVTALKDTSSLVRSSAVRCAEPYLLSEKPEVIKALTSSPAMKSDIEMVIQTFNSINTSGTVSPVLLGFRDKIAEHFQDNETISALAQAQRSEFADKQAELKQKKLGAAFSKSMKRGKVIYQQLCFSCHGNDGKGTPMPGQEGEKLAPSFVGSARVLGRGGESTIRTLLHGLTGDLDGREYEGLMVAMANNDDLWIADVANYIRNSFGNQADFVRAENVAVLRKEHSSRKKPWTQKELEALEPQPLTNKKKWKLSASHKSKDLKLAVDGNPKSRYTTGAGQEPGMWIQIEFPKETELDAIVLDSQRSARDFPRGYQVQVSANGRQWSQALASGTGKNPITNISLPAGTKGRFVRITQTGKIKNLFWSIHEIEIYGN